MSSFCNGFGTNTGSSSRAKFDDPFLLPSAEYMPETMHEAMNFCRYLYLNNPEYRRASHRVTRHFIQDYRIDAQSDHEKAEVKDFLDYKLKLRLAMMEMGDDWSCFAGDTAVPTREGVFKIKELAGRTADVINENGDFSKAEFNSFGEQPLIKVELKDGQTFHATPEHLWKVKIGNGELKDVRTENLRLSHVIPRQAAQRPEKDADYQAGVRHGFIFGDGCKDNQSKPNSQTRACFIGEKDKAMWPFFEDHHNAIKPRKDETRYDAWFQCGHPGNYKDLPSDTESPAYWYGFVCGFIAADGHVDKRDGCVSISQSRKWVLEKIAPHLPRFGMIATSIGGPFERTGKFTGRDGTTYECDGEMFVLRIQRRSVVEDDLILTDHVSSFNVNKTPDLNYGEFVGIKSLTKTDRVEEVFCCLEPETHKFVIGNGILTSNCYGNAYYRVHFPFKRMLFRVNPKGKKIWYDIGAFALDDLKFHLNDLKYSLKDPATGVVEKFEFIDVKQKNKDAIALVKYDPRLIDVIHANYTKKTRYLYRLPDNIVADVRANNIFQINNLSKKMLTAIRDKKNLLFSENEMFHFKAPTISGVSDGGYGLPEIIANFRLLYQLQVYKKIDESVALDYMLPFRLLSLDKSGSGNTSAQKMDAVEWKRNMQHIIKTRRKDKTAMFAVPGPVSYSESGGEGKSLAPKDLIEYQTNNMLNAMGYPAELYNMSLKSESLPSAIRLFEQTFWFIHENYNNFTRWVVNKINNYLNNQRIDVSILPPSMADNIEKQNLMLQLVAQGEISRSHVFKWLGIDDPVEEFRDRQNEEAEFAKIEKEVQERTQREMESQESLRAAADAGTEPPADQPGTTPMDVEEKAMATAQDWLSIEGDGDRRQAMNATKVQDFQLYTMAKQIMEEQRRAGASEGRQQVGAQAQQG